MYHERARFINLKYNKTTQYSYVGMNNCLKLNPPIKRVHAVMVVSSFGWCIVGVAMNFL